MTRRLTETAIRNLERPAVVGDGGRGSYGLQVRAHRTKSGIITKSFRQVVRINGKVTNLGLGSWPYTSLDRARELCISNIISIRSGNDPRTRKRSPQVAVAPVAAPEPVATFPNIPTFIEAGEQVIMLRRPG